MKYTESEFKAALHRKGLRVVPLSDGPSWGFLVAMVLMSLIFGSALFISGMLYQHGTGALS